MYVFGTERTRGERHTKVGPWRRGIHDLVLLGMHACNAIP
jgi:hypothetical protein